MTLTIGFTAAKARRGRKPAHDSVLRSLRSFAAHPIPLQNTKDIVTQGDVSRTNPSILPKPPHHTQPPLTSSLSCLPACGLHSSALASNPTQGLSFFAAFMGQKCRKIKHWRRFCGNLIHKSTQTKQAVSSFSFALFTIFLLPSNPPFQSCIPANSSHLQVPFRPLRINHKSSTIPA